MTTGQKTAMVIVAVLVAVDAAETPKPAEAGTQQRGPVAERPASTRAGEIADKFILLHAETKDCAQAWVRLRKQYEAEAAAAGKDPAQAWKSVSGKAFEAISKRMLQEAIRGLKDSRDLRVLSWDEIEPAVQNGVLAERVWVKGKVREPEIARSLVDLVIVKVDGKGRIERVVSVYSCKTSARERYQQDLYWAEKLRGRGIKFCFATLDETFIDYASGRSKSNRKSLTLARAVYDRVYLLTERKITVDPLVFRSLWDAARDVENWVKGY